MQRRENGEVVVVLRLVDDELHQTYALLLFHGIQLVHGVPRGLRELLSLVGSLPGCPPLLRTSPRIVSHEGVEKEPPLLPSRVDMNPAVSLEQTASVNFEVVPPVPDREELEVVSEHRRHWRDADILAHQHEASQLSPRVRDELTWRQIELRQDLVVQLV